MKLLLVWLIPALLLVSWWLCVQPPIRRLFFCPRKRHRAHKEPFVTSVYALEICRDCNRQIRYTEINRNLHFPGAPLDYDPPKPSKDVQ